MRKKQKAYYWLMGKYEKMTDLNDKLVVMMHNYRTTYKEAIKARNQYKKMWKKYNKKYGAK